MGVSPGRRSFAAAVFVSGAFSLVFIARTSFVVDGVRYFALFDDAMISMRYARNLATGHGLVWNAGLLPVEGYTNFLWTLWMAALHLLPVAESKISLLVMLTGAAILAAHLAIVRRIALHLAPNSPRAAAAAVWLTALYYPLFYWTLRGMEVGLVTLTLSASVLLALRLSERFRSADLAALSTLMSIGVLTRPDVVVPGLVIAAFAVGTAHAGRRRAVTLALAGAIVCTIALQTAFRLAYYGDALPNTYYLKVSGAALSARLARGVTGLLLIGVLHLPVPLALGGGFLIVRARASDARRGEYLLAAIFVAVCAYSAYVGGDAWDSMLYANRYMTPGVSGLLVLTALAIDDLVERRASAGAAMSACGLFIAAAGLTTIAPLVTHGLTVTTMDERLRWVRALLTAVPLLGLLMRARARALAVAVLTVGVLVATNGLAFAMWLGHNAFYVDDDAWTTRYGLALRAATSDDATVAVTWAGAIPYFSHRRSIDLLGKSDPVVAKQPPQPAAGFNPGHDKWDYRYSVGTLAPDLVAQLWHATDADTADIEAFGYRRLSPWVFVRNGTSRVDARAVQRVACAILRDDPFVLGSTTISLPDRDRVLRYCRE